MEQILFVSVTTLLQLFCMIVGTVTLIKTRKEKLVIPVTLGVTVMLNTLLCLGNTTYFVDNQCTSSVWSLVCLSFIFVTLLFIYTILIFDKCLYQYNRKEKPVVRCRHYKNPLGACVEICCPFLKTK